MIIDFLENHQNIMAIKMSSAIKIKYYSSFSFQLRKDAKTELIEIIKKNLISIYIGKNKF